VRVNRRMGSLGERRGVRSSLGGIVQSGLPTVLYGGTGFGGGASLMTAFPAVQGDGTTGLWICALAWWTSIPTGYGYLSGCFGGATGWGIEQNAASLTFFIDATGTYSPTYTITVGVVNTPMVIVGWWDGSAVRLSVNGVEVGSGTADATYAPNNSPMAFNSRNTGTSGSEAYLAGLVGADTFINAADATDLYAQYVATRRTPLGTAQSAAHRWDVSEQVTGASFPAGLTDSIGSDDMSFTVGSEADVTLGSLAL